MNDTSIQRAAPELHAHADTQRPTVWEPAPNPFGAIHFSAMKAESPHSPSYVLVETTPGSGVMIEFNHNSDYAVDDARAEWVAAALNAALGATTNG